MRDIPQISRTALTSLAILARARTLNCQKVVHRQVTTLMIGFPRILWQHRSIPSMPILPKLRLTHTRKSATLLSSHCPLPVDGADAFCVGVGVDATGVGEIAIGGGAGADGTGAEDDATGAIAGVDATGAGVDASGVGAAGGGGQS
jgi:hypothetical protein